MDAGAVAGALILVAAVAVWFPADRDFRKRARGLESGSWYLTYFGILVPFVGPLAYWIWLRPDDAAKSASPDV